MKRFIVGAMLTSMLAISAHAQTTPAPTVPGTTSTPPANSGMPPARSTSPPASSNQDAGAPLSGANSFTENQAKSRIEQLGYSNVTGLAKDSEGIWRGTGMKDGRSQNVAIDFRGNIVVGQK